MVACYRNKVHGQSGSIVLRSPGSGVLVPCCTGVAWDVTDIGAGAFFEQLAWQGQLGLGSSGLPVLQVKQVWAAYAVQVVAVQVVLLRSIVKLEPGVWQLCHLGQC